ncbi:MAG: hypothetical protein E3J23_08625 [Candidatus Stahlbacteria bacterium]|nr:MAG: hypothetical protein E3J23_08625 [Candidatus Stahlbacteria bacterium]
MTRRLKIKEAEKLMRKELESMTYEAMVHDLITGEEMELLNSMVWSAKIKPENKEENNVNS